MSRNADQVLWCLIDSDFTPFKAFLPSTSDVYDLKTAILESGNHRSLRGVDTKDLILWRLKDAIPVKPASTLRQRIKIHLSDLQKYCVQLEKSTDKLSMVVPDNLPEDTLRIIVQNLVQLPQLHGSIPRKHLDFDQTEIQRDSGDKIISLLNQGIQLPSVDHVVSLLPPTTPSLVYDKQYQKNIQDKMISFIDGKRKLRIWEPQDGPFRDHIASLAVPLIERLPSLLIHDLGRINHDDNLEARIAELFQQGSSQPIFLCNTSGSGKTRLIFEGFTRHWGMYFTARTIPDHIGSTDLGEEVLGLANKFLDITEENYSRAVHHNNSLVAHHIQAVVFARYFVFRLFLECAKALPGGIVNDHKRIWLLAQISPSRFFGSDKFAEVTKLACMWSDGAIYPAWVRERLAIQAILGPGTIYNALDEAQFFLSLYTEYLRSREERNEERPVLRDIIKVMPLPLIVSGTGLSMREVSKSSESMVLKEGLDPEIFADLGAFDDWDIHHRYLKHYLPEGLMTAELVHRIRYWLSGRYRFTATYISRLIENNFASPHRVLNDFVFGFASFRPLDGDAVIEVNNEPHLQMLRPYRHIYLDPFKDDLPEMFTIAGFIFDYIFTGKPRSLGAKETENLVDLGIARFKGFQSTMNYGDTTMDEPLAILAGLDYFHSLNISLETFILDNLKTMAGSARGPAFKNFCAYMLALAFSSPIRLDTVFNFLTTTDIGGQEAQLVALERAGNHYVVHPVDITSRSISTYLFGSSPSSEIETLSWMKNPARTTFCFPSHTVGPDIIFILRVTDGNLIPILVQCKQYTRNLSADDTAAAFLSIDPSSFISKRERDESGKKLSMKTRSANPPLKRDLQNALQELASGSDQTKAIRVLISYPANPNLRTIKTAVKIGNYPCATVKLGNIVKDHGR